MGDFILEYWLEFVFGTIATVLGFFVRHYWCLYKKEKNTEKKSDKKQLISEIDHKIENLEQKSDKRDDELLDKIIILKQGLLSIQGHQFRSMCCELLNPDHDITLDEYEQITTDHDIYNSLGGNHRGDNLFKLVEQKVQQQTKA